MTKKSTLTYQDCKVVRTAGLFIPSRFLPAALSACSPQSPILPPLGLSLARPPYVLVQTQYLVLDGYLRDRSANWLRASLFPRRQSVLDRWFPPRHHPVV